MKKNVAGQVIGAQMVSATDGSAFAGSVTVVVAIDGGTQTASAGTGPTHEGNGCHKYLPTQAETNGAHVAYTFTGSGAVPVTVQVYPQVVAGNGYPQTDVYSLGNTTQTGHDIGAGVLLTVGTGAGQVLLSSGIVEADMATVNGNSVADNGSGAIRAQLANSVAHAGTGATLTLGAFSLLGNSTITGNTSVSGTVTHGNMTVTGNLAAGNITTGGAVVSTFDPAGDTVANVTTVANAGNATLGNNTHLGNMSAVTGITASADNAAIADAVWDEALSGHTGSGSAGEAMAAAGTAGDPWTTAVPGAYGAGTAGYIIGNNVDATISSRGTYDGGDITGNVSGSVGSVTGAVGSVTGNVAAVTGNVGGNVVGSVASVTGTVGGIAGTLTTLDALDTAQDTQHAATISAIGNLTDVSVADILTTQMTESYAADGTAPTLAQALFLIQQQLGDFAISGTTITVKKLDGSTTAATFTLDDATTPTSTTRTT